MSSVRLTDEQAELLRAVAAAYEQVSERTGQKESVMFYTAAGDTADPASGIAGWRESTQPMSEPPA